MANRRVALRAPYDTTDNDFPQQPNYRQDYNGRPEFNGRQDFNGRHYSPRVQDRGGSRGATSRGPSRLDLLEERIAQQEKNSQQLIERAFKTKEEVIESLNFTHGTWQEEKHARNMLQEHIRTITAVVNRLNNDISSVEETIRVRDSAAVGTNTAVKNLEVHHVASLTDLRGRIVRADTSIAKLSTDMRSVLDSMRQMTQQQQEGQNRVMERVHGLESKLVAVQNQIDRSSSEQKMKLTHLEGDTGQQMASLDSRTKQIIDDLKNSISQFQVNTESEREKLEARIGSALDRHAQIRDSLIEKLEHKTEENHYNLDSKIHKLEEVVLEERQRLAEMQQNLETKIVTRLDSSIRQQQEEIAKTKRDTRDGFSTVHESISNMKTVMEGKRKLLEDQLRKEISQVRKMVVLV